MNRKQVIAAIAFAVVGAAAVAQEATPDTWTQVAPSKSFAQVRAELAQARQDGTIKAWSAGYIEKVAASKSREEVRAELSEARASGELAAIGGEAHTFAPGAHASTVAALSR
jgi:hypothetical protein